MLKHEHQQECKILTNDFAPLDGLLKTGY